MAIIRNFNGASIRKPGAYSATRVNLTGGFPLAPTGIVAIVGEAEGGEPGSSAGVQTYTSEDIAALVERYKSGPIVDAARVLIAPARDGRVANGAGLIRIYKTNASLKSSLDLENAAAVTLFELESANYGKDENLISVKVEAGVNPLARIFTFKKKTTTEVMPENERAEWLSIQYTGGDTSCDLTLQGNVLVTATSGTAADDLSIDLDGLSLKDVVDQVNSHASYTCTTSLSRANSRQAVDLDPISTATDIKTAAVTLYAAQKELLDIINQQSILVTASRVANVEGAPAAIGPVFMSGAAKGASTNASFQAGFDALLALRCNTVVPLISRDATDLASEGLTAASSSFTVDSVNSQALTHCITASNTKNRSERNCYVSLKDTFANSREKSLAMNHERASMLFQDVEVLASSGNLEWKDPWAAACILAGIQAGTEVGTPATFKGINVNGIRHSDYNPKTQVDLAIDDGLLPLEERDEGGFRVVIHNSTYSVDANFVYNRPSVLEAADYVAYNLRRQLEAIYVGTKAKTGTAASIRSSVASIMSAFLSGDIIVGDDTNDGLGYKDLIVTMAGNTAFIDVTITPVEGVDHILARITLDSTQQSA